MNLIQEDLVTTDAVDWLSTETTRVSVLRLDKIHPVISGNKWYKLRYYLQEAKNQRKKIATFGGAYSNHIIATAAACAQEGIQCLGIIRGEAPAIYSPTLQDAAAAGMDLHFISREAYKSTKLPDGISGNDYYIIPEGGYGIDGARGAATIPADAAKFDAVFCAAGTGTMTAGLVLAAPAATKITSFSVLKNHHNLRAEINALLPPEFTNRFEINNDFHFGGYAKCNTELIGFMNELYAATGIPTDFVYTAKLFYGTKTIIQKRLTNCSNLLVVHSGGLQGNRSLPKGTLIF